MTPSGDPRQPILVLGGTSEGRALAERLHEEGYRVVSSLAGRTSQPTLPAGEVRIGGFGGADGLTDWLQRHEAAAVVDATHPYAERISDAAMTACRQIEVPLLRLERLGWLGEASDKLWRTVADLDAAAEHATRRQRVFLSIGRQGLGAFAHIDETWFLIRCIEPPEPPLPPNSMVILDRGPFTKFGEMWLLRRYLIDLIVTHDSGGPMTQAKLQAARELRIPVVMVRRPPPPNVITVTNVDDAVHWVRSLVDSRASRSR